MVLGKAVSHDTSFDIRVKGTAVVACGGFTAVTDWCDGIIGAEAEARQQLLPLPVAKHICLLLEYQNQPHIYVTCIHVFIIPSDV